MRINHNIAALNTHRQLTGNQNATQGSLEKLSSGLRINKAGDDAAGLAISEKMRGQIRGLDMASKNAQDGISLIQTAEGALNETHDILQRVRELAVQSSNDTNTDNDRAEIQKEVDQLASELSRISNDTEFNTQNLVGGNFNGTFHIGANEGQNLAVQIDAMDAHTLGIARDTTVTTLTTVSGAEAEVSLGNTYGAAVVDGAEITFEATANVSGIVTVTLGSDISGIDDITIEIANGDTSVVGTGDFEGITFTIAGDGNAISSETISVVDVTTSARAATFNADGSVNQKAVAAGGIDISSQETADAAITKIQSAIDTVSAERSKLGAFQNRLDHTINNLGTSSENLTAAESRIRDVDMASEMMEFTKNNILSQAAQSMLAQANQQPQGVLQLLQ